MAEQGSHEKLVDSGGIYSELWSGESAVETLIYV